MAKRKRRDGEVVCRCGAYRFPHRQFGGRCVSPVLHDTWRDHMYSKCRDCILFDRNDEGIASCQAIEGLEEWHEAPCVQEHIQQHEIRLYGVNRPPPKRMGWRRG